MRNYSIFAGVISAAVLTLMIGCSRSDERATETRTNQWGTTDDRTSWQREFEERSRDLKAEMDELSRKIQSTRAENREALESQLRALREQEQEFNRFYITHADATDDKWEAAKSDIKARWEVFEKNWSDFYSDAKSRLESVSN